MPRTLTSRSKCSLIERRFGHSRVVLVNGDRRVDHPKALSFRDGLGLFAGPGGVPWIFDYQSVSQFIGDLKNNTIDKS